MVSFIVWVKVHIDTVCYADAIYTTAWIAALSVPEGKCYQLAGIRCSRILPINCWQRLALGRTLQP